MSNMKYFSFQQEIFLTFVILIFKNLGRCFKKKSKAQTSWYKSFQGKKKRYWTESYIFKHPHTNNSLNMMHMPLYGLPVSFWSYFMLQPKYVTHRPSQFNHSFSNILWICPLKMSCLGLEYHPCSLTVYKFHCIWQSPNFLMKIPKFQYQTHLLIFPEWGALQHMPLYAAFL